MGKFGYRSIDGWLESDDKEYSEVTSEATQALFDYIYVPDTYYTIQEAIDAATSGDIIEVAAGTYDEQLVIDKSLTLQGVGDTTIIQPSGAGVLTTVKTTPWIGTGTKKMAAIVFVDTANEVTVSNLKIDGSLITEVPAGVGGGEWVAGLAYLETSGTIDSVTVIGNPNIGCRAAGIWASAISSFSTVEVTQCDVIGYNRAGIYAVGGTMTADYNHNTITGPGGHDTQVPNGMFFMEGAIGSVSYNTITALDYLGETYRSTGIGTYRPGSGVTFGHNEISNVQNAFAIAGGSGATIEYNYVHDCHTGVKLEAIEVDRARNVIIQYNDIMDNDFAIRAGGDMGDGNVAHYNNFVGNLGPEWFWDPDTWIGAVSNVHTTYVLNAKNNWWGCNEGPGESGCDSVSANVDYTPWTTQGQDNDVDTTAGTPEDIDTTGTNASITLTTSTNQTDATVTVQQYTENPQGDFGVAELGKFINIESTISDDDIIEVEIRIYYTDEELLASGLDETTLRLYWWDGDSWEVAATEEGKYGVNTAENYVWAITDHFSDYGAGGETDVEGPVIIFDHISQPYPNPADDEFTIYVYVNITDPSGVKDYPELSWKIKDRGGSTVYDIGETTMNPLNRLYYGGITAPKIDGLEIIYQITAEDNLGYITTNPEDYVHLFYYDGLAPVTTLTIGTPQHGIDNLYVTSLTGFTLICDDGVNGNGCNKTFYKINDGEFTEYSVQFTISGDDGEYPIYYYSIDNSNNVEEIKNKTVILDNTAPNTTDNSSSDWTNFDVMVTLSPTDSGSSVATTYYCVGDINCVPSQIDTLEVSVTCAPDTVCEQYVRYYSIDKLGNTESVKTSNLIKIDKEKPSTTDSGTDTDWHNEDVTITLNPTDAGSDVASTKYCIYLEGEAVCDPIVDGEEGTEVIVSDEGENYVRYFSVDAVGNQEDVQEAANTVKIDKANPVLEYYSRTNPTDTNMKADDTDAPDTVGYGYYDHIGDGFRWTSEDIQLQNISIRFYNGDPDTDGTLIEGANVAGCDLDPLWLDPTDGSIIPKPDGIFYEKYLEFGLWGSDYEYPGTDGIYDGTDTCDPFFNNLHIAGEVYYEITAYDLAGNLGRLVGVLNFNQEWERDTEDPTTVDDYGEKNNTWQNSIQTIALTEDCGSSDCQWTRYCIGESCNPEIGTDYTAPVPITNEGTTYFKYASKDNAYNKQETVEIIIKIDLTDPIIEDDYANSGVWVNSEQTVTLYPIDLVSGIDKVQYCEGSDCGNILTWLILNVPYDLSYNTSQDTIVSYIAWDKAGNPSDVGEFHIMIDREAPIISDDAPEGWQNTGFTVTLYPQDDVGIKEVTYCIGETCDPSTGTLLESPYELTYSTEDNKTIRYQAWDVVDNPSTIGSFNVRIDTTVPKILTATPGGTLNTNEVELFVETNEETICKYDDHTDSFENLRYFLGDNETLAINHTKSLILSDKTYNYKVKCQDKAGNEAQDTIYFEVSTTGNYCIVRPETGYFVDTGWASFVLPVFPVLSGTDESCGYDTPELRSPQNILSSLDGNYEIVWYYDGSSWLSYDPNAPEWVNDLTEFNDVLGNPYWIKMINADRLELENLSP